MRSMRSLINLVEASAVTELPAFKAWFAGSEVVDAEGRPLKLYRGLYTSYVQTVDRMEPRQGYAMFFSDSPHVAATYAGYANEPWGNEGAIFPVYVKATLREYKPMTGGRYPSFDMFAFDRAATRLKAGEGIVARNVRDMGPRGSLKYDPEKRYSYPSDVYSFGRGTSIKSATGNRGTFDASKPTMRETLREAVDVASPHFRQWFAKSKVRDNAGHPLLCYHGRVFGQHHRFPPLTHFGTLRAADDRIGDVMDTPQRWIDPHFGEPHEPHIYPVYLRIENPVTIPDCGIPPHGKFDPDCIYDALVRQRVISARKAQQLQANRLRVWDVLADLGYDGARYRNDEEDRGSMSWIIFSSDQVWPVYADAPD